MIPVGDFLGPGSWPMLQYRPSNARMDAGKRQGRGASQADADNDPVATAVTAALAKQEQTFMLLPDTQTKALQACLQASVDSFNTRMGHFLKENVRELAELKIGLSVQF